ncbi:MAG: insulinase family protein [Nitrospirota bacterium]|nr:insulinase family protein [Nitrospirota bacterium]
MTHAQPGAKPSPWAPLLALLISLLLPVPAPAMEIELPVHRTVLDNGLTLLVVPRHQAPVFSAVIMVRAGALDEPAGATGVAHLMEHMAFKGTRTIGTTDYRAERQLLEQIDDRMGEFLVLSDAGADPARLEALETEIDRLRKAAKALVVQDEFGKLYGRHGSVGLNAGTSSDYTAYFVSLPANRLPLWAAVEAERMATPVFREFYSERDVVLEERRMRVDSSPGGRLNEQFFATAFTASPYRNPTIGWESDVARLTRGQAYDFFHDHYTPGNTVIALVGDLDPLEAERQVRATFGRIPARDAVSVHATREPEPQGPRRVTVLDEAGPALTLGFLKPSVGHPDDAVLDVIDTILSGGSSSRLRRALVLEQRVAVGVATRNGGPGGRLNNLFLMSATPAAPDLLEKTEAALFSELERLRTEPVTELELARARTLVEASQVRSHESNSGLAQGLAWAECIAGSWRYLFDIQEEINRVSADDVLRVARRYLTPERAVIAELKAPVEDTK